MKRIRVKNVTKENITEWLRIYWPYRRTNSKKENKKTTKHETNLKITCSACNKCTTKSKT